MFGCDFAQDNLSDEVSGRNFYAEVQLTVNLKVSYSYIYSCGAHMHIGDGICLGWRHTGLLTSVWRSLYLHSKDK